LYKHEVPRYVVLETAQYEYSPDHFVSKCLMSFSQNKGPHFLAIETNFRFLENRSDDTEWWSALRVRV